MTEIMKILAGSRLYGTATPDSDTDYKSVHLPTKSQILLGKRDQVNSTSSGGADKNGAQDVDVESFELQRYLSLAAGMQTVPVEMLFAPPLEKNKLWDHIVANREKILSKNPASFVGYCKAQAMKYGLRGDRLNTVKSVVEVLTVAALDSAPNVMEAKAELMAIQGVRVIPRAQPGGVLVDYLDVYGRQVPMTIKVGEAIKVYEKPLKEAGSRAKAAAANDGTDWKALYHAYRIADQGVQLFREGYIVFPSRKAPTLMQIRRGELSVDAVLEAFDERRADMEEMAAHSDLPESPDREWIEALVLEVHEDIVAGRR